MFEGKSSTWDGVTGNGATGNGATGNGATGNGATVEICSYGAPASVY